MSFGKKGSNCERKCEMEPIFVGYLRIRAHKLLQKVAEHHPSNDNARHKELANKYRVSIKPNHESDDFATLR